MGSSFLESQLRSLGVLYGLRTDNLQNDGFGAQDGIFLICSMYTCKQGVPEV